MPGVVAPWSGIKCCARLGACRAESVLAARNVPLVRGSRPTGCPRDKVRPLGNPTDSARSTGEGTEGACVRYLLNQQEEDGPMAQTQERSAEAWWIETGAEEWSDAIVAAMKLGGVDNLFFV